MGSYYREHVSFPNVSAGPYPPQLLASLENIGTNDANAHNDSANDDPNNRRCSVKGCSSPLPPDYPHKMCDECRGRHRVYAMTKRAKRKMEKALLTGSAQNGQSVVWMPQDETVHSEPETSQPTQSDAGPSRQFEPPSQVPGVEEDNLADFEFPSGWDPQMIDPRLFSHTSELAGALTLPNTQAEAMHQDMYTRTDHAPQTSSHANPSSSAASLPPPPPPASSAPEIHPVLAEVLKGVPNFSLPTRITSGPTVNGSASSIEGPLPPRFCSIKGCKTLIAGNSFFKMCEPCRDRYRNYGTTKRAKWKRVKEVAVTQLQKSVPEQGPAPAPSPQPTESDHWPPSFEQPAAEPIAADVSPAMSPPLPEAESNGTPPPRMCTVSHCREVLPGNYQYLRCERHRIQNRHHSKLKRVRDKEIKAQVHDGWAAAVSAQGSGGSPIGEMGEDSMMPDMTAQDIAQVFGDLEKELRDSSLGPDFASAIAEADADSATAAQVEATPLGEPSSGLPPAARGTRRTNHICSIKTCANLLSPSNPWKMCDLCRSRDRAGRRLKALRDCGLIPPEVAEGKIVEVKMEVETGTKEKSTKKEKIKKPPKQKKSKKVASVPVVEPTPSQPLAEGTVTAMSSSGSGSDGTLSMDSGMGPPAEVRPEEPTGADPPAPPAMVDASGGSIDPSALHRSSVEVETESHPDASVFDGVSLSGDENLAFMGPILGDIASTLQRHFAQLASEGGNVSEAGPSALQDHVMDVESTNPEPHVPTPPPVETPAPSAPSRKRNKGKGKAKATQSAPAPDSAPTQLAEQSNVPNAPPPQDEVPAPVASSSTSTVSMEGAPPPPPPYAPPPNGQPPYPYYMPPPYMPPYGSPLSYQYGYPPPPSPTKGPYGPPPMYQPPYGAYPYGFPYHGQPYPYHGQQYPPPPGQGYQPPHPYHVVEQSLPPPPVAQPYPPQIQPYPYSHSYAPPAPYPQASSPPAPTAVHATEPVNTSSIPAPTPAGTASTGDPAVTDSLPPETTQQSQSHPQESNREPESTARKPTTFIVRTSETYDNPPVNNNRPSFIIKRRRDDELGDMSPNKRAELESIGTFSQLRLPPPDTSAPGDVTEDSDVVQEEHAGPSADGASGRTQCSGKHCKRVLPGGTVGSLCERCRERLRKRQAKAKHRFKLEPKTLLGRSGGEADGLAVAGV